MKMVRGLKRKELLRKYIKALHLKDYATVNKLKIKVFPNFKDERKE